MKIILKYLVILILAVSCGDNQELKSKPVPEPDTNEAPEAENNFKYNSYKKNITLMEADRKLIESRLDVDNAKRYIIKAFDNHKTKIQPKPSSPE